MKNQINKTWTSVDFARVAAGQDYRPASDSSSSILLPRNRATSQKPDEVTRAVLISFRPARGDE
jgi:hypothetical protein